MFLRDEKACTFNFTPMVDVTGSVWLSIQLYLHLPPNFLNFSRSFSINFCSACESCWEGHKHCLSRSWSKGLFSSNHSRASLTASASRFICVSTGHCEVNHLSRLLSKYVNWHLRSGSGSVPSTCGLKHNISSFLCSTLLLTWLPSSVFALYRCHIRCQTSHDRSNGQHRFHGCWNSVSYTHLTLPTIYSV